MRWISLCVNNEFDLILGDTGFTNGEMSLGFGGIHLTFKKTL